MNASPLLIMHERSLVFIKDGAICTALDDDPDVEFTMEGTSVDPATRAELREMVWTVLAELGTEFCTRHVRRGDELVSEMIIDGVARPDMDQPMLWISPDDGWTVAP